MPGRKMPRKTESGTGNTVGRLPDDRAEIGREREKRPRNRLCRAITGEKGVVADPARCHESLVQQGQHDMTATEHERA